MSNHLNKTDRVESEIKGTLPQQPSQSTTWTTLYYFRSLELGGSTTLSCGKGFLNVLIRGLSHMYINQCSPRIMHQWRVRIQTCRSPCNSPRCCKVSASLGCPYLASLTGRWPPCLSSLSLLSIRSLRIAS